MSFLCIFNHSKTCDKDMEVSAQPQLMPLQLNNFKGNIKTMIVMVVDLDVSCILVI